MILSDFYTLLMHLMASKEDLFLELLPSDVWRHFAVCFLRYFDLFDSVFMLVSADKHWQFTTVMASNVVVQLKVS